MRAPCKVLSHYTLPVAYLGDSCNFTRDVDVRLENGKGAMLRLVGILLVGALATAADAEYSCVVIAPGSHPLVVRGARELSEALSKRHACPVRESDREIEGAIALRVGT